MTLEDAIRRFEKKAEVKEDILQRAKRYAADTGKEAECIRKDAEENRQLAEWLKDYKRLLARESGENVRCGTCIHYGKEDQACYMCYQYSRWEGEQR